MQVFPAFLVLVAGLGLPGAGERPLAALPATSEVVPDDRLPVLSVVKVSGPAANPLAQCILRNDSTRQFSYFVRTKGLPNYVIQQRRNGGWESASATSGPPGLTRIDLAPGANTEFTADLSGLRGPFRLSLDLYKDSNSSPVSVSSRELKLTGDAAGAADNVPVIQCDLVTLKLVQRVEPNYPEVAKRAHLEGTVVLEVVVGKNGRVHDVRVVTGASVFDAAAVEAVNQWMYTPPRDHRGRPVAVYSHVTVNFEIPRAT